MPLTMSYIYTTILSIALYPKTFNRVSIYDLPISNSEKLSFKLHLRSHLYTCLSSAIISIFKPTPK